MNTPVLTAITSLRNRLHDLRKKEDGFTLIENTLGMLILGILMAGVFVVLILASKTMHSFVYDPTDGKSTVALTKTLQREAAHIIATTPQDHRIGAVINTADFDAILRSKTSQTIPSTYTYYLCKTAHSQVFIAAYDTERTAEGFSEQRPFVYDGTGYDISGMNNVSCGQWEKKDRLKTDQFGNLVYDDKGKPVEIKAGDFIWKPVDFGTL